MGLDRAPIEFQTFYFSHVLVVPPSVHLLLHFKASIAGSFLEGNATNNNGVL